MIAPAAVGKAERFAPVCFAVVAVAGTGTGFVAAAG